MRRIRGRDCSGNPFWGTQWRKKIVAESANCPPKIYLKNSQSKSWYVSSLELR